MGTNESIRLRTEVGSSKNIVVKLNQEFDTIDFLSLKITQDEAYRNFCSDYGVVAGRVIANDGFGVSNAKVSIFIPLSSEDQEDPIISTLYPYFTPTDTDSNGVRYNLLPSSGKVFDVTIKVPNREYEPGNVQDPNSSYFAGGNNDFSSLGQFLVGSEWDLIPEESIFGVGGSSKWKRTIVSNYGPKTAVGTFPSKTKMLNNDSLLEVHEKYYKYTTKTNGSGDYMLFGIPIGVRTIHMDVDLSDIGGDSLVPDDFINLGFPNTQFDLINNKFKGGTNLDILPQIEGQNLSIDVIPFWGNTEQCEIGITRQDFNLTKTITPSALLVFETFTNGDSNKYIKHGGNNNDGCGNSNYGDNDKFGEIKRMVNLGVGVEALAINPTGEDLTPAQFNDGKVLFTVPMYEKRKVTNEFGDIVDGDDSSGVGIPTSGKYNIFVHSLVDNVDGTFEKNGFGSHIIDNVEYRYDFENGKKLIYTPGLWNAVGSYPQSDYPQGDSQRNSLSLNTDSPGNNQGFPRTAYWGSKYRHAGIDDNTNITNWPVCYGSLYFPRFEFEIQGNGDLLYCDNVVRDYENDTDLFGNPSSYQARFVYQGTPEDDFPRWGIKGVLNITDILKFFKTFDGNLNSTSSDNWIFNNFSLNPDFQVNNIDRLSNETYIFTSSKPLNTDGTVNYPDSLDKIAEQNTWIDYNTKVGTFSYLPGSPETGTKSKEGRYMFYFGLKKNNTVLEKLKNYLGV